MKFSRKWAMPSPDTFTIQPIKELLERYVSGEMVVDPFARNSKIGTLRNDINPETTADYHMDAIEFLEKLVNDGIKADTFLFDPPYSPRQITEVYASFGKAATAEDTQNGRTNRLCRILADKLIRPGGTVICCGWNSSGIGGRAYQFEEIMLVPHGGPHNDTIVTVETKIQAVLF